MTSPSDKSDLDPNRPDRPGTPLANALHNPGNRRNDLLHQALVHQLQVHKAELELQNEALRSSQIALEESRSRYVDLYEFAPIGYLTLDADGLIAEINLTGTRLLGMERRKLLRRQFVSLVVANDQVRWMQLFQATKNAPEIATIEVELQCGDGTVICARLVCTADSAQSSIRVALSDISERKEIAAKLEQALAKAEAATRAKSEFLAHMSHEIRTPINAIVAAARLMEHEDLTQRQRGYSNIMRHSSHSLLALIDDILDLSRIEAGCIEFKSEVFDFPNVIEELIGVGTTLTQNKDVELKFELAPDLPTRLVGDPFRLGQVLNNLLSNAIKFTKVGSITLRVEQVSANENSAFLRFALTDTGIGVPRAKLESIFEAFTQADELITRMHGGSGLGLTISRKLVQMMGGTIGVDSVPEKGSRFTFTASFGLAGADPCPLESAHRAETKCEGTGAGSAISALAGRRILIVEDNEFNRHVLEGMLKHIGVEVDAAIDGHDGVECFQVGSPYDAVLMDLHLPGLDGFACARKIRTLPHGAGVPIIALTADTLPTTAAQCFAAGMSAHLVKPVVPEVLERTLIHSIVDHTPAALLTALPHAQDGADSLPRFLPGIDVAKASNWAHGSARAFKELLNLMLSHTATDPDRLLQYLGADNVDAAARITHDLKAAATTVGASTLAAASECLNQEIRAGRVHSALAREALASIRVEFVRLQEASEILHARLE